LKILFSEDKCNETLTSWQACHKTLWTNLYPDKNTTNQMKVQLQSIGGEAAPVAAQAGKKNIRDYINDQLKAKGRAPHA